MLKIGSTSIKSIHAGETVIQKAFLGALPVFDTVPTYPETLNECTWAQISRLSEDGTFLDHYAIGDTKTIVLNGNVGNTTFSNVAIDLFVIGVDHNVAVEGGHRIHFQMGKISGVLSSLNDSKYGSAISSAGYFSMNTSNANSGGWESCQMRTNILGGNGTPMAPTANTLMAALPADLRAVMKAVTKFTNNVGGTSDLSGNVTATTEYLCLPSEFEYYGKQTYANSEGAKQAQYQYYALGGRDLKIHHQYNLASKTLECWERSPRKGYAGQFCNVDPTGYENAYNASISLSIAPILFV